MVVTAISADQPVRNWTSNDGKTLQASLLKFQDAKVTLKLRDGRETTVPLDRLGAADRDYLAQLASAEAGDPATPASPMILKDNDPLPKKVDLQKNFKLWNLKPRSQGSRNTCSVFVTTGAFEFALCKQQNGGTPLSVEYLNWACNKEIGNSKEDRGQFFHDLLKGFEDHGICHEELMVYEPAFKNSAPSAKALEDARKLRKMGFKTHWIKPWSKDAGMTDQQFEAIQRVLANGWPVCAGSNHSRLFVGYEESSKLDGGGRFITRDSGLGGYGEVTFEWTRKNVYDVFWIELPPQK